MYNSIVGHACSAWVSLTSLHTTTGVDPVRETTCVPHKDGGIALMPCPKTQANKYAGLFSTLSL